jgi:hypothetical protein
MAGYPLEYLGNVVSHYLNIQCWLEFEYEWKGPGTVPVPQYLLISRVGTWQQKQVALKLVWYTGTVPTCKFYPHHIDADPDADPDPDYQLMWIRMRIRILIQVLQKNDADSQHFLRCPLPGLKVMVRYATLVATSQYRILQIPLCF